MKCSVDKESKKERVDGNEDYFEDVSTNVDSYLGNDTCGWDDKATWKGSDIFCESRSDYH